MGERPKEKLTLELRMKNFLSPISAFKLSFEFWMGFLRVCWGRRSWRNYLKFMFSSLISQLMMVKAKGANSRVSAFLIHSRRLRHILTEHLGFHEELVFQRQQFWLSFSKLPHIQVVEQQPNSRQIISQLVDGRRAAGNTMWWKWEIKMKNPL